MKHCIYVYMLMIAIRFKGTHINNTAFSMPNKSTKYIKLSIIM